MNRERAASDPRPTSLRVGALAFGFSASVHAAALLAPVSRPLVLAQNPQDAVVEIAVEPSPTPELAEAAGTTPATSTADAPHESALPPERQTRVPEAKRERHVIPDESAVAAEPSIAATRDTPRFVIAIGDAPTSYGAVSATGAGPAAASRAIEAAGAPMDEAVVDEKARLVRGLSPAYPNAARIKGVEGDVLLELVVGTGGAVESARVVHGVGDGLDEAALAAVREYRFAPAKKAGNAVRVRMQWWMQFRLRWDSR